jgi:hypothetical protein
MGSRLYCVVVDSRDPATLARFWAQVLAFQVVDGTANEVLVARDEHTYPALLFIQVPESKTIKNRLHLDLAPDDRDTEVARLIELGAHRVDIGQGPDVSWVVLADPEGNEFCVLSTREGGL